MDQLNDIIRGISLEVCLLLMTMCSLLRLSSAVHSSNATYPPYRVIPLGEDDGSKDGAAFSETKLLPVNSEQTHIHQLVQPIKTLEIQWLNSTTDSISFSWRLSNIYTVEGFIRESMVEYLQEGGKFSSLPLNPSVKEYTFRNLDVDTTYTVCVYMIEVHGPENKTTLTHSRCVKINTIDYIRQDSVVIVVLTLGYYVFMGVLGFTQWKRKCWAIAKRNRAKGSDCNSTVDKDKYAMRWKDLEQREKLVTKPGCSIETNNT